ncbi:MAG TPA: hypothetical protein VE954_15640 [Oligoflexus sp.]|uniref:hypothetical protein n=1 Tax=Oligoflexus sp. TaxID=1971216 RepID=UPI002D6BBB33|nr:hypothetical protein [Oligoflexus sp.]HYX34534.1 hypothetical protein [Oligoflexus sp.]
MRYILVFLILLAWPQVQCTSKSLKSGNAISNTDGVQGKPDKGSEEPIGLPGYPLICVPVNVPFDADDASTIGCGFYDQKTNARVSQKTFSSNIDWSFDPSTLMGGAEVSIFKSAEANSTDQYDVYYSFRSFSVNFTELVNALIIVMDVTDLNGQRVVYRDGDFASRTPPPKPGTPGADAPGDIVSGP